MNSKIIIIAFFNLGFVGYTVAPDPNGCTDHGQPSCSMDQLLCNAGWDFEGCKLPDYCMTIGKF